MKTLLLTLLLATLTGAGWAHSPQISTVTLTQNKDSTWTLMMRASLSAYQYELADGCINCQTNSILAADFQPLLLAHLRENIRIRANGSDTISLQKGQVVLGHQTDVRFDVVGMPEQVQLLDVQQLSFAGLGQHVCILRVITLTSGSSTSVLQQDNDYAVSLAQQDNVLAEVTRSSETNWLPWGAGAGGLLLVLLLVRVQWLRNQKKPATQTGNVWRQQSTHHHLPQA